MANYLPSDTKNLEMLRSAADALESKNLEMLRSAADALESNNKELTLAADALELTASELTLAVSRLISQKEKKKAALDRRSQIRGGL